MKKFGFGKKGEDGDDANRSALFGRKKSPPTTQADNPYAQASQPNDPYANMTAYQKARHAVPQTGGHSSPGGSSYGQPPPGANGYGAPAAPGKFNSDRYGSGGGYGGNRYGNPADDRNGTSAGGARGPGGYGGLGRSDDADSNRDALFSGAQERYQHRHDTEAPPPTYSQSGADDGAYSGYGEQRELTAEEQEEADYQAVLQQKKKVQQESVGSVNRSLQMARQANEVGQATLARLGAQGERLHNTEKNLDLAANQNKIAQDRAAELKTLNRSMFAVHVGNPFTSKQRQMKADEDVLNRHRAERDQREATRKDGYAANQRMEDTFKDINRGPAPRKKAGAKDYGKFNLDDEDDEARQLEDQIDDGIDELSQQVHMMNTVGRAIGKEVDTQNKQIGRIMDKSDAVDDQTRMNRERIARIK